MQGVRQRPHRADAATRPAPTATAPATTPARWPRSSPAGKPRKTDGADIRVGVSVDQHVATAIGDKTRFPSLELGSERGGSAGNCDSGYSCAYSAQPLLARRTTPNAKEVDPKAVFDRLFGGSDPKELAEARAKRERYNKSILDFVREDAKGLTKTLGAGDQRKLDEYLVERPRDRAADREGATSRTPAPRAEAGHGRRPSGIPARLCRSTSGSWAT